jgi:hypothetical protein
VVGVLQTVLQMLEQGATHIGVATDHVIESFRNDLWPDYKTGEGIEPVLFSQFHPLEQALAAMGVAVWPMVELEADDALASAARIASKNRRVEKVCIWTVDKDLAQCVVEDRVVQIDRRAKKILDAEGVRQKFGVTHALIPISLALVGDAADNIRGFRGSAASRSAAIEPLRRDRNFPPALLRNRRDQALLFGVATLETDATVPQCRRTAGAYRPALSPEWTERMETPPARARIQGAKALRSRVANCAQVRARRVNTPRHVRS